MKVAAPLQDYKSVATRLIQIVRELPHTAGQIEEPPFAPAAWVAPYRFEAAVTGIAPVFADAGEVYGGERFGDVPGFSLHGSVLHPGPLAAFIRLSSLLPNQVEVAPHW